MNLYSLNYAKLILQKVSFDQDLFSKELSKAIQNLKRNEARQLIDWVNLHYHSYSSHLQLRPVRV